MGEDAGTNLYAYVENDPINSFDPLGLDTCTCDRKIGGGPAKNRPSSILPTVTHTFTFTKNANGTIKHTYSWGNTANEHGWNKDQPEDIAAAKEAVANGYLQWEGGSALDPYVDQAFNELNLPANEHRNLGVARNCKTEAGNLLDQAKADQAAAGK